ncbi:hypothetical protein CP8484711_0600 [Chlamydia psittaci 84-8471/1]|nr:hypothetical protein CP8484711_0600 [Chlamydia psittaci 84-8471/1]
MSLKNIGALEYTAPPLGEVNLLSLVCPINTAQLEQENVLIPVMV